MMQRVTLRVPGKQVEMLDALVKIGDFPSVSEAIRAGVRDMVDRRCGRGKFGDNVSGGKK